MGNRVALVSMPFASVFHPAIGISLLQAGLKRELIPCDIYYLNLSFAQMIGLEKYCWLGELSPPCSLVGDWIFSQSLFGQRTESDIEYVQAVLHKQFGNYFNLGLILSLLNIRELVESFLDICLNDIHWDEYDVVGFTSSFQQNVAALALAWRIKQIHRNIKIIFGGANCEGEMGIELHKRFPFIDFVCSGEGDQVFPEFVKRLLSDNDTGGMPAIITRSGGRTVVPNQLLSPVFNLDILPYPSYDDYFEQLKKTKLYSSFVPMVPFESSRGCWWGSKMHCTFCGLNGLTMEYRSKTPNRALEEVVYLGEKYGKSILSVDNILDLKYLDTFFQDLADRKLGFTFHYEAKVNLKKRQIKVLRDAGVLHLQPGIESLSSPILKLMKKGCNLLQNIQCLKWCAESGIQVAWNFLYGFPGEPALEYEEIAKLLPSLTHLEPPISCGVVRMDRHSPYFVNPTTYGLSNIRPYPAYSYVYPFDDKTLFSLAYYFDFDHRGKSDIDTYAYQILKGIHSWQSDHSQGSLIAIPTAETLIVIDKRIQGNELTTIIREPLRTAYILCDEAKTISTIRSYILGKFPELDLTEASLQEDLNRMVSQRLMIKEGRTYLSLAILQGSEAYEDQHSMAIMDVPKSSS